MAFLALALGLVLLCPGAAVSAAADSLSRSDSSKISLCGQSDSLARTACIDSLGRELKRRDSLLTDINKNTRLGGAGNDGDPDAVTKERSSGYFLGFMGDWGEHGIDGGDFTKALFVVTAVVVIGGTLFYLPFIVYKMVRNKEKDPVVQEVALAYTYSSSYWEGGGSPLYRDTHMPGMRYSAIIAHPRVGLGLTVEGGYLAPDFAATWDPLTQVDLRGAYGLLGPILRFGAQGPLHLSLEFLNGTSTSEAVGWVTKTRAALQVDMGRHALIGFHIGSLFYDLRFFDGTLWRRGNFNRDLTLTLGMETGYRF